MQTVCTTIEQLYEETRVSVKPEFIFRTHKTKIDKIRTTKCVTEILNVNKETKVFSGGLDSKLAFQ